jgi:hypothetical protein
MNRNTAGAMARITTWVSLNNQPYEEITAAVKMLDVDSLHANSFVQAEADRPFLRLPKIL